MEDQEELTLTEKKLLALLDRLYKAGGQPVSSTVLAKRLGISRMSITRYLKKHRSTVEAFKQEGEYGLVYKPK